MPPKKFQSLDDFLGDDTPKKNQVQSPFGGYYTKKASETGNQNSRNWNGGSQYQKQRAHPQYSGQTNQQYQGNYQNYQQSQGYYQNYQQQQYSQQSYSSNVSPVSSGTPSRVSSSVSVSSLANSLAGLEVSPVSAILQKIPECTTLAECKKTIQGIIDELNVEGRSLSCIQEWDLGEAITKLSKPKSPALQQEAAMLLISQLANSVSGKTPEEAYLIPFVPLALDSMPNKENNVKRASQHAVDAIFGLLPIEAQTSVLLPVLLSYLKSGVKWQSKLAALQLIDRIREESPNDLLEMTFKDTIPVLTDVATDFKPELAKQGYKTLYDYVSILDNLDLSPRFKLIVDTLQDPTKVPESVKSLSSVTFVAEVTEPALSILVPILNRSLNLSSSTQEQLRQTVIVVENLTRLVNNRREIESFIPLLQPGVEKVLKTASLPEVRELAEKALDVLIEDSKEDEKFSGKITLTEGTEFLQKQLDFTPYALKEDSVIVEYLSKIITFDANVNDWKRLEEYLTLVFGTDSAAFVDEHFVQQLRHLFHQEVAATNDDEGIEIVNTDFSLAYGSRMLLNKTNLRLLKGHRYGLCGRNGAGKSTLMRSIANGQLEGFPDKDTLRTCFVEHKLQGEEGDLDLVAFIALDPQLQNVSKEEISAALESVGFDDFRRSQTVGSLSGGWKMKLELARAMLQRADILLLDEPTNHLDVANVKWLEEYLLEHTDITSLIVSHDSGFLDRVCTDIIHYENKKLAYYKGNLAAFVEQKPEAKAYYTLTDSNAQMRFPPPGILSGVKSNTRAVAKMSDVTFAYPGAAKPSLANVSCALSLSSRVAILGPNGAGKSTLIKLLTGELVPQAGKVEKHPNLRIGYIAQHALQHVNEHKEKTANQYLQWRYQFGDDREVLLKESRKISEQEKEMMEKEIDINDGRGKRSIEAIVGRQKYKKSFQYEVKWKWWKPKYNSWVPKDVLLEHGFDKLVQKFDDHEASREGLGYRELTPAVITKHFEDVGLDAEITNHTPLGSLSGGQLVKVVIAGAMWNNPHLLVLDEPTNYLDRDSLGALAFAIREWTGGVVMISHNNEFVGALCPEQWIVENGKMVQKGVQQVDHARFADGGNANAVGLNVEARAAVVDDDSPANIKVKKRKKRMTRNEKKAQTERRRLRYIEWLSSAKGTPRPPDTDDEEEDEEEEEKNDTKIFIRTL
ncbi:LAMI_0G09516g1_1 [Lachancea mirantina]|uniref:LAMI_0G09516g1_1 n=1 Tax=Lachancea mirantina TaxID=1230905 RepID=A0A1G4KAC5_9SACH|nr:LAMI_0G09516g1_1 [Lachancea mirantina]